MGDDSWAGMPTGPLLGKGSASSFCGVVWSFFFPGSVNKGMPPKRGTFAFESSPSPASAAFFAASSTLNDSSFDVPSVCRLMCAA